MNTEIPEVVITDPENMVSIFTSENIELAEIILSQISSSLSNGQDTAELFKLRYADDIDDVYSIIITSSKKTWKRDLTFLLDIFQPVEDYERCGLINKLKKNIK